MNGWPLPGVVTDCHSIIPIRAPRMSALWMSPPVTPGGHSPWKKAAATQERSVCRRSSVAQFRHVDARVTVAEARSRQLGPGPRDRVAVCLNALFARAAPPCVKSQVHRRVESPSSQVTVVPSHRRMHSRHRARSRDHQPVARAPHYSRLAPSLLPPALTAVCPVRVFRWAYKSARSESCRSFNSPSGISELGRLRWLAMSGRSTRYV